MLKGTIIKNISNAYTVLVNNKTYVCTPRGKFRNEKVTPLVGDHVWIDEENNLILAIEERINVLQRPHVANVDIALIVTSLKEPNFSTTLLDEEITSVLLRHVSPVICITKKDLLENNPYEIILKYYESIGIPVFYNTNLEELKNYLQNKFVVLTGQTGAGKSTLLNHLNPNLNLKTSSISNALNRGVHTTRHVEIYFIEQIMFCDTPGFSSLDFSEYSKEEVRDCFTEFQKYPCVYKDCMHLKENVCHVKEEVNHGLILKSRYKSYELIMKGLKK